MNQLGESLAREQKPHFTFTLKMGERLEVVIHTEAENLDGAVKVLGTVWDKLNPQPPEARQIDGGPALADSQ